MIAIEKATARDWKWPGIFLALGVLGVVVAVRFFFQAFPEASIDLKVARSEIAQRSEQFLRGRGFDPARYRHVTVFDFDEQAKTYLERELGLEQANRVMGTTAHIWRWRTRWVRPPQKEEFSVWLTTDGTLAGFEHEVEENREGPKLSKEEARRIAEVFLRAERGVDLARYQLVTDDVKERPRRLDYTFTWEELGVRYKDARPRMSVTVLGDQVGEFREFLKIPEQWVRDYQRLRSRNEVLGVVATVLYILLFLAAIVVIVRTSRRRAPWIALTAIGGVVGVLWAANFWNEFGLQTRFMPTNVSWEVWTTLYLVGMVLLGISVAFYVLVLVAAGEPLYRELAPERVSIAHLFTFRGLRSKEFFNSTLIGYGMAGMHVGLVTLFYVMARRFGAWSPLDVNYNNAISTALPWLSPLSTSSMAATTEEFAFRLFAIPLFLKWTKNKWIAVIVPAFMWGFLHSGYPQQPAWIRGVEVGSIGIVAGWVFLRFGILATLVWHYTVDAVLIGMFLLRSDQALYRVSGAIVGDAVLLPLVIGGVFYLQSRGFLRDDRILNGAPEVEEEAQPIEVAAPVVPAAGLPFAWIKRSALVRLAVLGVIGAIAIVSLDVPSAGEHVTFRVSRAQAESVALAHLRVLRVPVEKYRHVTWLEDDIPGTASEYLVEHGGIARAAAIYRDQVPAAFWHTRLFQPPRKEEYAVWVTPEGEVARVQHQLDEKAPGARLEKPEALAEATRFLDANATRARVHLADYHLVEHDLERRDARNDHSLEWEANRKLLAEAAHRIVVAVRGDEANGPRHWIKLPEEWERQHTRPTLLTLMPVILMVGFSMAGLYLFARALQRRSVAWRPHVWVGIAGALTQIVGVCLNWPSLQQNMQTSVPWETSLLIFVMGGLIGAVFIGAFLTLLSVAAHTLLTERFGPVTLWPATPSERGRAVLQGLLAGAVAALFFVGFRSAIDFMTAAIVSPARGVRSGLPSVEPSMVPSLSIVVHVLFFAFIRTLLLFAALAVAFRLFRTRRAFVIAALVATLLMACAAIGPIHLAKTWVSLVATVAAFALIVATLRWNVVAWLTMSFVVTALARMGPTFRHPGIAGPSFVAAGILGAIVLVVVVWALAQSRRGAGEAATVAGLSGPAA